MPRLGPAQAAQVARLRYVNDEEHPGITRKGRPGRFRYILPSGRRLRGQSILNRIRAMAIPPAWTDVWIAPFANAHLLATGRDAKGRKQYRYHPDFAAARDADKYASLIDFAESLPKLRKQLKRDLRKAGLPREKVLAAIVTLLEETLIRIGNEDYARANGSFGLTTLRNRHVKVKGADLRFLFKGKSGKQWSLSLQDRRVARVVRSCQELPGQHLFEYKNVEGAVCVVSSSDVNAYLREITGREVSAKDFRTWAGTVKAAMGCWARRDNASKQALRAVIASVADALGNTMAVCRKCYIHPLIIAAFENQTLALRIPAHEKPGLSAPERAVLAFLKRSAGT